VCFTKELLIFLHLFLSGVLYSTLFYTASSAAPQIPDSSEDAGIEPRIVANLALAVRRSNNSARSHRIIDQILSAKKKYA
jgi:hypothetical protein